MQRGTARGVQELNEDLSLNETLKIRRSNHTYFFLTTISTYYSQNYQFNILPETFHKYFHHPYPHEKDHIEQEIPIRLIRCSFHCTKIL